jgi:ABC-type multidrug transport system fused ATPase/permease subunit
MYIHYFNELCQCNLCEYRWVTDISNWCRWVYDHVHFVVIRCMCVNTHIIYTYIYRYILIYIYMYIYMYICMYINIFIYIYTMDFHFFCLTMYVNWIFYHKVFESSFIFCTDVIMIFLAVEWKRQKSCTYNISLFTSFSHNRLISSYKSPSNLCRETR